MTKSLMFSIKPKHGISVLNLFKTRELRKTIPKDLDKIIKEQGGIWAYFYMTKENYKVHRVIDFKKFALVGANARFQYVNLNSSHITFALRPYLNGKVVARFWLNDYDKLSHQHFWDRTAYIGINKNMAWEIDNDYLELLQLDYQEVFDYGLKKEPHYHQKDLYSLHIKGLEIFETPMELSDFYKMDVDSELPNDYTLKDLFAIQKAPQSWQYVYVE